MAGAVRDRLSTDNWRVLNRLLQLFTRRPAPAVDLDDALELIDDALVSLVAVGGLEMAHMTRDDGWRFLSLGRHLERLHFVATTLERRRAGPGRRPDRGLLEWLLELSDSLLTYRVRHMQQPGMGSRSSTCMLVRRAQPAIGAGSSWRSSPSTSGCCRMPTPVESGGVEQLLHDCRARRTTSSGELFGRERRLERLLTRRRTRCRAPRMR